MASTSEVYGGKSARIAHRYSTELITQIPQNKHSRPSHKYKILPPQIQNVTTALAIPH